jgi:hypothetical protein
MAIVYVGIDLAKNVFAVHGVDERGKPALVLAAVPRAKLHELIASLPPCTIAMEACSGGHHWARLFMTHGHSVRLIAPKFVAPQRNGEVRGIHAQARQRASGPQAAQACLEPLLRSEGFDRHINPAAMCEPHDLGHRVDPATVDDMTCPHLPPSAAPLRADPDAGGFRAAEARRHDVRTHEAPAHR